MGLVLQIWFNNEELEKIVALAGTTDKKEVTKFIKDKSLLDLTGTQTQLSNKENSDRLKNLKLTIDCWKGLLEIRDSVPFKVDPMAILQGTQTLEAPKLTMLNDGKTEQETAVSQNKISWIHYCKVGNIEREISIDYNQCVRCGEVCK